MTIPNIRLGGGFKSMVVSGSHKRWDRWPMMIPQLAVYIYIRIYTTYSPCFSGGTHMLLIPPFDGNQKQPLILGMIFTPTEPLGSDPTDLRR